MPRAARRFSRVFAAGGPPASSSTRSLMRGLSGSDGSGSEAGEVPCRCLVRRRVCLGATAFSPARPPPRRPSTKLQLSVDLIGLCTFRVYLWIDGNLRMCRSCGAATRHTPCPLGWASLTRPAILADPRRPHLPVERDMSSTCPGKEVRSQHSTWSIAPEQTHGKRLTPRLDHGFDGQSHGSLRVCLSHIDPPPGLPELRTLAVAPGSANRVRRPQSLYASSKCPPRVAISAVVPPPQA